MGDWLPIVCLIGYEGSCIGFALQSVSTVAGSIAGDHLEKING